MDSIIDKLTETINDTVAHFAAQKIVVDLWQIDNPAVATTDTMMDTAIQKFFIESASERCGISDESSITNMVSLVNTQSLALSDAIGAILDDNEDQVQPEIMDALDIILGQVDGFKKLFDSRVAKFKKECERDDNPFARRKQLFEDLIQKSFSSLIDETISAVYRGIKITGNPIYDLVLQEINGFLKNVGISTLEVKLGSKIDFETCTYANEETAKDTEDINLDDCIYEVTQLPYFFGSEILVSPGKVCAWRFKK